MVLFQVATVYWPPLQSLLGASALDARRWIIAIAVASSVLVLEEARKLLVVGGRSFG